MSSKIKLTNAQGKVLTIENPDTNLSDMTIYPMDNVVNVKAYGAKGDGVTDDTAAIQAALNQRGLIYIPPGDYICSTTLTIYEDTRLYGVNHNTSKLSFTSGTGNCIILETTASSADIIIEKLNINNTTTNNRALIVMPDFGQVSNVYILDNVLFNANESRAKIIHLISEMSNVRIENNLMYGNPNADVNIETWYDDQYAICISTQSSSENNEKIRILNNTIIGCATGYGHTGVNFPTTNIMMQNNIFRSQTHRAVSFYHGRDVICTNNVFENITATSSNIDDGGVIWLDAFTDTGFDDTGIIFSDNIIRNCIGNAVYCEELRASIISNNSISYMLQRTADTFSKDWTYSTETQTYTSDGGHGILITGGTRANTIIQGNSISWCEGNGIYAIRALGDHPEYPILDLSIENNTISNCSMHGISCEEHFEASLSIKNNKILGNGAGDVTNLFYGINISSKNSLILSPTTILIHGNTIENGYSSYSNNQYKGIYKSTPAGTVLITDNTIETNGGKWLEILNTTYLKITDNVLLDSRGMTTSGNTSIRNNLGYKTELLTTVGVTGTATVAHGLATTPRGVFCTPKSTTSAFIVVATNIGDTNFDIKVYNHDGTVASTYTAISVYAFVDNIDDI